ncbi:putative transcriptional regulatory protein [Colletotrichum siamense]|uniref:Transcriptional regulatory protein n=1 Tax=Colletotrichum siamense TaxID=690259 RepID=A0A9P5F2F4_COLSI|nr:putative transcriptional regulatory protein [Colletotrichum siamense]KAF4865011.1 putative transcriptional regulatory protein [Colletotrichum siamense]KAF4866123.1 putative transcriptional regulatory protein [Colletotrichum siamense]
MRVGGTTSQLPLKSDSLDFLIEAGPRVDEAGLSSLFDITSQELPSKEAATKCIQAFFECVAFFFPIIDRDVFMSRMEMMYTPQRPRPNALDYCLFHLVVSLGALVQRCTSAQTEDMDRVYLSSYQKAWSMMSDALASPCETSLQILILHIFIHTKSGREGFAWVLCGLAIRVAQSLGLHQKSPTDMGFSERRIILRSRLWCILFGFDSSLSLVQGRPPGISSGLYDKDISYLDELSQSDSPSEPPSRAQMSNWWYKLSQIQNQYCAVMQTKHSLVSRLDSISEANQRLAVWKDSLPSSYRPDGTILVSPENYWHVVLLHLEYFNFLRTIHLAGTVLRLSCSAVAHQNSSEYQASEVICVEAARCFIKILNNSSTGDIATRKGRIIGFHSTNYMSAIAVLYRSIMRNPSDISSRADLEYLRAGKLHLEHDCPVSIAIPTVTKLFNDMLSTAEEAVQKRKYCII